MSSSLVLLDEFTISSALANVTIGGGSSGSSGLNYSIDDTYNVYILTINNLQVSADDVPIMRVTKSGTAQSDAVYDSAGTYLKSDASFTSFGTQDNNKIDCMTTIESSVSGGNGNAIYYFFNFPNTGEFSFVTIEEAHFQQNDNAVRGIQAGFAHTVASASDGVFIALDAGNNMTAGTFKLYGLNK